MSGLFRFFFKYPALVFGQGDFTFAASRSTMLGLIALAVVGAAALVTYRGVTTEGRTRDRVAFVALRLALIAVVLFCLLRPSLILKAAVPQQNFLGVLIDDSRSMTIADRDDQPRTAFVQQQFGQPDSPLLKSLSDKFVLRFFRFSSSADRLGKPTDLQYAGTSTHVGQALERARDELSGLPLAGLVMVTDGADTSDASLDESLASLKARQIPVFPVGVGTDRFARDIQVTRVETPRSTLKGTRRGRRRDLADRFRRQKVRSTSRTRGGSSAEEVTLPRRSTTTAVNLGQRRRRGCSSSHRAAACEQVPRTTSAMRWWKSGIGTSACSIWKVSRASR